MSTQVATVTFTRVDPDTGKRVYHDVRVALVLPIEPGEDTSELAWEAAEQWPESGWGTDDPSAWWVSKIVVSGSCEV